MISQIRQIRLGLIMSLLVGMIFIISASIGVVLINYNGRKQALVEAKSKARILLDRNMATHMYFTHDLKPDLFKLIDPLITEDYFNPVWMSSTFAIRQIDTYFKSFSPTAYYYKECAVNALFT